MIMSRIGTVSGESKWGLVGILALLVFAGQQMVTTQGAAQTLRKGVHVEMASSQSAVALPDADKADALVVAITHDGTTYLGIAPTAPSALAGKRDLFSRAGGKLYVKADARTPYAYVSKVLDAVRTAGVTAPNLLTGQHETPVPGKPVSPKGLEVRVGPALPSGKEATVVELSSSGPQTPRLKINNQDIPWANLDSGLRQALSSRSAKGVLVKADGQLPYGDVVHVIDVCHASGAKVFLAPVLVPMPVALAPAPCPLRKAFS
jgi:biopolymer transport protein ExbD